jgi:phage terminase large subunit-like protein
LATGENSPEVYAAAASTEQARIVFDQAKRFVEGSPKLQDWLKPYRSVIECEANGGIFRVLSADGPLQHGLNPSLVVIDELWAHKNPELYYALTTGQGARENPLIVDVTTAGFDRKTVCHHVFEHGQRLQRAGLHAMREERFFFQWFAAEQGANIEDRDQWLKANPSSWIDIDGLERERKRLPPNVFRRLHMNQWTEVEDAWITPPSWDRCRGYPVFDPKLPVYMAVDVGITRDSAAWLRRPNCCTRWWRPAASSMTAARSSAAKSSPPWRRRRNAAAGVSRSAKAGNASTRASAWRWWSTGRSA